MSDFSSSILKAEAVPVDSTEVTASSPTPAEGPELLLAGSTVQPGMPHFDGITDDLILPHTWSTTQYDNFLLRVGPNYKKTKAKAPSPFPFYEPVGIE